MVPGAARRPRELSRAKAVLCAMRPLSLRRRPMRATGVLVVSYGVVLFVAAGTLAYWQAWLYLTLQLATMVGVNLYLEAHDPALLDRRLRLDETGETEPTQRIVMRLMRV